MAAIPKQVHLNRSRSVGGFLLKRLFMPPRHPRRYTPSSVPNPSPYPGVLDILVRPRINVGSVSAFHTLRIRLGFVPAPSISDKLMIWTRRLTFTLVWVPAPRSIVSHHGSPAAADAAALESQIRDNRISAWIWAIWNRTQIH